MSGIEITKTNQTAYSVEAQWRPCAYLSADHFLQFASVLQKAIDAGLPPDTEVKVAYLGSEDRNDDGSHVTIVKVWAEATVVQEIS